MKKIYYLLLCSVLFIACTNKKPTATSLENTTIEEIAETQNEPVVYDVLEKSYLLADPSDNAEKLVNEKATRALGTTEYLSIDNSCTVKVIEDNGEWVKVQVVSPDWLSQSHKGWVKKNIIQNPNEAEPLNLIEGTDYELLKEANLGHVTNYYFYYPKYKDEKELHAVSKFLKNKYNPGGVANIYIFDSNQLGELVDKYPLSDNEYLKVADHFTYNYDMDGVGQYYPFQDIKYKELGGSNWKKEPIK